MGVTENLYEALVSLSSSDRILSLPVCIDAICLNQSDDVERAREVASMDSIYRGAVEVIMWLGPAEDNSDLIMEWLPKIVHVPGESVGEPLAADDEMLDVKSALWPALEALMARPYFQRLWTLQEGVLASVANYRCGSHEVARIGLDKAVSQFWASKLHRTSLLRDVETVNATLSVVSIRNPAILGANVPDMDEFWKEASAPQSKLVRPLFRTLLPLVMSRKATDPRDKVYGILGMVSDKVRRQLTVSYNSSIEDVYLQAGKAAIEEDHGGVDYLSMASSQYKVGEFPSWCFDFCEPRATKLFTFVCSAGVLSGSEAAYHDWHSDARVDLTTRELSLSAYHVEFVRDITVNADTNDKPEAWSFWAKWLDQCHNVASSVIAIDKGNAFDVWRAHCHILTTSLPSQILSPITFMFHLDLFLRKINAKPLDLPDATLDGCELKQEVIDWLLLRTATPATGRAYFSTDQGRLGYGPPGLQTGDLIMVIPGAKQLHVLRSCDDGDKYVYVEDAWIDGFMEWDLTPKKLFKEKRRYVII